jgi:hypothetical protein
MRVPLTACVAFFLLGALAAQAGPIPTGQLEYRLYWNGIPAANAVIDVSEGGDRQSPVYTVEVGTRTNRFIDLFWSLRGKAVSRFQPATWSPLGFEFDRKVNDKRRETQIIFPPSGPHATGFSRKNGKLTRVVDATDPALLDPITAIFSAISRPVQVGDAFVYDVFTGQDRYRVKLDVAAEETISVGAGTFPALRVEPMVWKLGKGLESRLHQVTIWVAKDPIRIPLRIRSEVFIGAVNCDLQRADLPADDRSTAEALIPQGVATHAPPRG